MPHFSTPVTIRTASLSDVPADAAERLLEYVAETVLGVDVSAYDAAANDVFDAYFRLRGLLPNEVVSGAEKGDVETSPSAQAYLLGRASMAQAVLTAVAERQARVADRGAINTYPGAFAILASGPRKLADLARQLNIAADTWVAHMRKLDLVEADESGDETVFRLTRRGMTSYGIGLPLDREAMLSPMDEHAAVVAALANGITDALSLADHCRLDAAQAARAIDALRHSGAVVLAPHRHGARHYLSEAAKRIVLKPGVATASSVRESILQASEAASGVGMGR